MPELVSLLDRPFRAVTNGWGYVTIRQAAIVIRNAPCTELSTHFFTYDALPRGLLVIVGDDVQIVDRVTGRCVDVSSGNASTINYLRIFDGIVVERHHTAMMLELIARHPEIAHLSVYTPSEGDQRRDEGLLRCLKQ